LNLIKSDTKFSSKIAHFCAVEQFQKNSEKAVLNLKSAYPISREHRCIIVSLTENQSLCLEYAPQIKNTELGRTNFNKYHFNNCVSSICSKNEDLF